jgi:hypothetical protein
MIVDTSFGIVPARFSRKVWNVRENVSSHIALSALVTVRRIDGTATSLVPFNTIFNLGNKKKSIRAKPREQGGWNG